MLQSRAQRNRVIDQRPLPTCVRVIHIVRYQDIALYQVEPLCLAERLRREIPVTQDNPGCGKG
eukprot:4200433-Pyramimonas_sp.AAC.1